MPPKLTLPLTNKPQHHPSRSPEDIGDKRYSLTSHHPLGEKLCQLYSCAANISQKNKQGFFSYNFICLGKTLEKNLGPFLYSPWPVCTTFYFSYSKLCLYHTSILQHCKKTTTTLRNGDMYNHIDLRYTGYICLKKVTKFWGFSLLYHQNCLLLGGTDTKQTKNKCYLYVNKITICVDIKIIRNNIFFPPRVSSLFFI